MWSDNPSKIDFLNTGFILQTVQEIVNKEYLLPVSIGIYGAWGSGKSTVLGFLEEKLTEPQTIVVKCNLWVLQNYEDPTTALINCIMTELESTNPSEELSTLKNLAKDLSKNKLFDLFLGSIMPNNIKAFITAGIEQLAEKRVIQSLNEFQDKLNNFLETQQISKIVVLIDDLDRCSYNTIISTLESIKLFLFLPRMAFIMSMDQEIIQSALQGHFKNIGNIKVSDYFEKLIQVPIYLSSLSKTTMENYITSLYASQNDANQAAISTIIQEYSAIIIEQKNRNISILDTHKDHSNIKKIKPQVQELCALFIPLKYTTPRMCKRILNNVSLKKIYSDSLQLDIKDNVLTKLTLFEITDSTLFKEYVSYICSVKKPNLKEFYDKYKKEEIKITQEWLSLKPDIFNVNNILDYLFILQHFIESKRTFINNDTKILFDQIFESDIEIIALKSALKNNLLDYNEIWKYIKEDLVNEEPTQINKVIQNLLKIHTVKAFNEKIIAELWTMIKDKKQLLLGQKNKDTALLLNKAFKDNSFYPEFNGWQLDESIKKILNKE